jgi:hypothetical protein
MRMLGRVRNIRVITIITQINASRPNERSDSAIQCEVTSPSPIQEEQKGMNNVDAP